MYFGWDPTPVTAAEERVNGEHRTLCRGRQHPADAETPVERMAPGAQPFGLQIAAPSQNVRDLHVPARNVVEGVCETRESVLQVRTR